MKATDTLGHATLADSLNAACYAIGHAYLNGMQDLFGVGIPGRPTSGVCDELIPGMVYDLAIRAGWLPRPYEPEEDHGVPLGCYYVEEAHQQWFMGLLNESLSTLRDALSQNDADSEDLEADRLRTDLWNIILMRVLPYRTKRLTPQAQSETTERAQTSDSSPEPTSDMMPQWAKAFNESQVPEIGPDERRALEKRYLAAHRHPVYRDTFLVKEVSWLANVNPKQWERWRRGEIANNSVPGRRILNLLERNVPARSLKSLPERAYEKLTS